MATSGLQVDQELYSTTDHMLTMYILQVTNHAGKSITIVITISNTQQINYFQQANNKFKL